jgi:hypothetical protein
MDDIQPLRSFGVSQPPSEPSLACPKTPPLWRLQLLEFMAGRVQSLDCPQTLVFGRTRMVLKNLWNRNGHHIWLSSATENPRVTSPKPLRKMPEKGLQAGFFRYLSKPIKVKEFMDTLNAALEFADTQSGKSK